MVELGAAVRDRFSLDPDFLTVNHGSFGALPRVVAAAQDEWRRRLEAQPSFFMERVLPQALRDAASALARFLNVEAGDLAYVDNATTGCNAVLRSLDVETPPLLWALRLLTVTLVCALAIRRLAVRLGKDTGPPAAAPLTAFAVALGTPYLFYSRTFFAPLRRHAGARARRR